MPTVDNFILIKYSNKVISPPRACPVSAEDMKAYISLQEPLFYNMVDQIRRLYPRSKIHVLTNESVDCEDVIVHRRDFAGSHPAAKLLIYDLLDVPAMYLDTDVLLVSKFAPRHLNKESPFNVYSISRQYDLQLIAVSPLPRRSPTIFNAGVVWIARPSADLGESIRQMHGKYFSDRGFIESQSMWAENDEYAISTYLFSKGVFPRLDPIVNVPRHTMNHSDIPAMQSIHYTGFQNKRIFLEEYREFHHGRLSS